MPLIKLKPSTTQPDILLIGTIDFDSINLNEASVEKESKSPNIPKIGKCKVEVYGGEGSIPHFHITADNFDCCIRIHSSEYFDHGYHTDKLNNTQAKYLNDWLKRLNEINKESGIGGTNWNAIRAEWVRANPNCKFPNKYKTLVQPDYSKLNKEDEKDV